MDKRGEHNTRQLPPQIKILFIFIINTILIDINCNTIVNKRKMFGKVIVRVLIFVFINSELTTPVLSENTCIKPQLEIFIVDDEPAKTLKVFWQVEELQDEDKITLHKNFDPKIQGPGELHDSFFVQMSTGIKKFRVLFVQFPMDDITDETILGYTATYWRMFNGEQKILVRTWFKTSLKWMEHYWNILKDRLLYAIVLPGTHQSTSYQGIFSDTEKQVVPWKERSAVTRFGKRRVWNAIKSMNSHVITQDYRIYNQLLMGIRCLDIRPYKKGVGDYWTHHNGHVMISMSTVIDDIIKFIKITNKEIVILDVHKLYNTKSTFMSNRSKKKEHSDFIMWLKDKLQPNGTQLWAENSGANGWDKTLEEITVNNQRLIVSYTDKKTQEFFPDFLWLPIDHVWGKTIKVEKFFKGIQSKIKNVMNKPHALKIGEKSDFSVAVASVLVKIKGHREKAADKADSVFQFLREDDIGKKANILSVDFFLSTGVVRAAVIWNLRLSRMNDKEEFCDLSFFYNDYFQVNEPTIEQLKNN